MTNERIFLAKICLHFLHFVCRKLSSGLKSGAEGKAAFILFTSTLNAYVDMPFLIETAFLLIYQFHAVFLCC